MQIISAPAIVAFLLSSAILSAAQPVPVLRTQERAAHPVERPHGASPDGALALRTLVSDLDALSARANGYLAKRGLFDILETFGSKFMTLAEKNPKTAIAGTAAIGLAESLMERDNMLMSDANVVRRSMMVASDPRLTTSDSNALSARGISFAAAMAVMKESATAAPQLLRSGKVYIRVTCCSQTTTMRDGP
ncbi:unnamed protein product [Tilletia controversa]|nr:unnamed protein product [Tilletia controversa]